MSWCAGFPCLNFCRGKFCFVYFCVSSWSWLCPCSCVFVFPGKTSGDLRFLSWLVVVCRGYRGYRGYRGWWVRSRKENFHTQPRRLTSLPTTIFHRTRHRQQQQQQQQQHQQDHNLCIRRHRIKIVHNGRSKEKSSSIAHFPSGTTPTPATPATATDARLTTTTGTSITRRHVSASPDCCSSSSFASFGTPTFCRIDAQAVSTQEATSATQGRFRR